MRLLPSIFLLQTATPQGSEPSPDWALTLLGLTFASMIGLLAAVVGLVAWGISKASGGSRHKRRRPDRGGTWVSVPHDDLWIHFPGPEDANDRRRRRGTPKAAHRSRRGPYGADRWDEP